MALSRQQKRFAKRLIEDEAKVEFIAQKQSEKRQLIIDQQDYIDLQKYSIERNALISKRAEVAIVSLVLFLSYCFIVHG